MSFSWRTSGLQMVLIYKCKISKYFNYMCLNVSDFKTEFQNGDPNGTGLANTKHHH